MFAFEIGQKRAWKTYSVLEHTIIVKVYRLDRMESCVKLNRIHRRTVIACILFQAGGVGLLLNSTGLFMTGMTQEGLFNAQQISIYFTIRTIASALSVSFLTQQFYKRGVRKHLVSIVIMMALSYALLAFVMAPWMLYVGAIVAGVATSTIVIPIPIIIHQWFKEKQGVMLGLVFSASGIASALYNFVLSPMMSLWGWRASIGISAGIGIALMLPAALFWIFLSPEECQCEPYGQQSESEKPVIAHVAVGQASTSQFVFVACAIAFCGTLSALVNYIPMLALSKGFDMNMASLLTSLCMVGNVSGKLIIGTFFDWIGAFKTTVLTLILLIFSLVMMLSTNALLMMVGSALFGLNFGLYLLMPPALVLKLFGDALYKRMIGTMTAMASGLIALFSFLIGYFQQRTGNFDIILMISIVFVVISLGSILMLHKDETLFEFKQLPTES